MSIFWSIVFIIIILGVLCTVHELGHYLVARSLGIKAYEVSIFVGPSLVNWRHNGVDYEIRSIPIGAYVRFTDVDEEGNPVSSDDPSELVNSPRWKRLLVALAGPFMNLVLGFILFVCLYSFTGYGSLDIADAMYDSQFYNVLMEENQEVMTSDTLVAINGKRVFSYLEYSYEMYEGISSIDEVVLTIKSQSTGELYDLTLTPEISTRPMLGITHYPEVNEKYNGWEVIEVNESQNNGHPVLQVGDYLTHVNGISVASEEFEEFFYSMNEGDAMELTYIRNGVEYTSPCVKTMITYANQRGVIFYSYRVTDFKTFIGAVKTAAVMPISIIRLSVSVIQDAFEGQVEAYNVVSGPVGMTSAVVEVVDDVDTSKADKAITVLTLAAFISVGLVFTNMLPIPGLDGIQLILIIIEMIIGHSISKKTENIINGIGFCILIALVIFAFTSDIIRIILE
ncbi:MAG: RIP metalloprotease RseP [Saccharofermentans sp.]|nr:RIP metalloprotease RseP [Saccharofermentans sp.]